MPAKTSQDWERIMWAYRHQREKIVDELVLEIVKERSGLLREIDVFNYVLMRYPNHSSGKPPSEHTTLRRIRRHLDDDKLHVVRNDKGIRRLAYGPKPR